MGIAETLIKEQEALKSMRGNWESMWQEISDLVMPQRGDFNRKGTKGENRQNRIYEGTAPHSNDLLASALHGMMTNSSNKWFRLTHRNRTLGRIRSVKQWFQLVENIMFFEINKKQANFAPNMHEIYLDQGAFGTSPMFIQDMGDGVRFRSIHLGQCFIGENELGIVDRLNRVYEMSALNVVRQFGEQNTSEAVKKKARENPNDEIELLVKPREVRNASKIDKLNKPFRSVHIEVGTKKLIVEGGFDEFPYQVPRWSKLTGEIYGRSPTMVIMPDIRMVNQMMRTTIRGAQKVADPPLLLPDEGTLLPVRTSPSSLIFGGINANGRLMVQPLNTNARVDLAVNFMELIQKRIRDGYFIDQLQLNSGPQMTATEVVQRTEEKLRILGPILGRLQIEMLSPLLERTFNLLFRQGKFPRPPRDMQIAEIEIEYVSPMAQAQRSQDAIGLLRTFEMLTPLANVDPSVFDVFDPDAAGRGMSEINNVPFAWLRSPDEVAQIRQVRQEQIAKQQELENAATAAKAMQSMSQASATQSNQ